MILIILIISLFAIKDFFAPGFFPIHDDTQVQRVFEMGKALKDGMFPVRWVSDLGFGFGYPIFNFYAPLSYYFGGGLTLLSFDALMATKIMMGAGILLSGIFMYLLAKEFWGKIGGLISSIFYIYAPYHAVQIFVRGDVAEFWAYAFVPLAFLSVYRVFKEKQNSWRWVVIGAFAFSAIILSHNLTAMMVAPFLLIVTLLLSYIAYRKKEQFTIYNLLFTILLGLLLSAFYWVPALSEIKYTNVLSQIGGGADFKDHFVCINQLWESMWGFGGSAPGCIDGLSFRLGKAHIIFAIFSFALLPFVFRKDKKIFFTTLASQLLLIVSILLTLDFSRVFWEVIPPMAFFQFPWRFLILISFAMAFLSGFVVWYFKELKIYIGAIALLLLFYTTFHLFQAQTILAKKASDFTNEFSLKWTTSKISDEYMPKDFDKPKKFSQIPKEKLIIRIGDTKILKVEKKTGRIKAEINSSKNSIIHANVAFFPAWRVLIDGKSSNITQTNNGFNFSVSRGKSSIEIIFDQTPIEKVSNLLSLGGIILLFVGVIKSQKKALWRK